MTTRTRGSVAILAGLASAIAAPPASAQQPPPAPAAAPPAAPQPADTTPLPVPADLTQARPGGLTAEQAGTRAAQTSWSARASMENLRGAAARVDEAWASFLPRLSAVGKYTRLSNFTPPSIFNVAGDLVVANAGPARVVASPQGGVAETLLAAPVNFSFPFFVLDNWLLQATISIPISDYFLRIDQAYTAATQSQEASRWDIVTARAASEANGRIAYYTWLNARGAVIVAVQALNDQKTHVRDARNQFAAGNASKADVLRAETAMASAELTLERAKNLADLSEKQLRVAIHAPDGETIALGENLDTPVPPVQGNVKQMEIEALTSRP